MEKKDMEKIMRRYSVQYREKAEKCSRKIEDWSIIIGLIIGALIAIINIIINIINYMDFYQSIMLPFAFIFGLPALGMLIGFLFSCVITFFISGRYYI